MAGAIGQPFPDDSAIQCVVFACQGHRYYDEEAWEETDCETMPGSQANEELELAFEEGFKLLKSNGKAYGYMESRGVRVEYCDCDEMTYDEYLKEYR